MKKIYFFIVCFSCIVFNSFCQVVNIVKLSPQHLLDNTFSLSLEKASSPLAKTSLNISPFVTYYDRNVSQNVQEKLVGMGLELGKKLYVSSPDSSAPLNGFYAMGSLTYGYYSGDYQKSNDSLYQYNNYGYYYPTYTSTGKFYHENIHKLGADIAIGYQVSFKSVFYTDMFFGAGMRYAISSEGDHSNYKSSFLDIGHSGITPKAGIKFGLRF
jgi:hypothetical protein